MSKKQWDELYEETSREVERWRRQNRRATLTEIEETVDKELARMRAKMVQDLAMAAGSAELTRACYEL